MDPSATTHPADAPPFSGVEIATARNATTSSALAVVLAYKDFLILDAQIILGSLAIIYLGAHGSLRRPPSAAPPKKKKGKDQKPEDENFIHGMLPSDAILFPVLAGAILVGLYYLIQWLKDPEILNTILRWHMSITGFASLTCMCGHGIQLALSFVFPRYWRNRAGALVALDARQAGGMSRLEPANSGGAQELAKPKSSLPGRLSDLPLPAAADGLLWQLRRGLMRPWTVQMEFAGMGSEEVGVYISTVFGGVLSFVAVWAYHWTHARLLQNLLGYGFSYGSFMMLSPTTFTTATLVLVALFFYDIIMVFYT